MIKTTLVICVTVLGLLGCDGRPKHPTVTGVWRSEDTTRDGVTYHMILTLRENGTYRYRANREVGSGSLDAKGHYMVDGTNLTLLTTGTPSEAHVAIVTLTVDVMEIVGNGQRGKYTRQ